MKPLALLVVLSGVGLASAQGLELAYDLRSEPFTYVPSPAAFSRDAFGGRFEIAGALGTSLLDGRTVGGFVASQRWEWRPEGGGLTAYAGIGLFGFAGQGRKAFGGVMIQAGVRF